MKITRKILSLMVALVILMGNLLISASAAGIIMHGIGFVDATSLRLRSAPNTTAPILATAGNRECVVVISKAGQWYKVNYNLQEGYMHEDYLDVSTRENAELGLGLIQSAGVNFRSGPSTSHSIVAVSTAGAKCEIIGLNEGWYKVIYKDKTCYIRSDFVTLTEIPYENKASSKPPKYYRGGVSIGSAAPGASSGTNNAGLTGQQILSEAKKYLGCPYRAGGASPSGFDCSGFVYYVLKQVGYSPARTPEAQYGHGCSVNKGSLQVGDLVFFYGTYADRISHVGIYAGNGQFIHAPNSSSPVSYSDLTSGYWADHYYGARRVTS